MSSLLCKRTDLYTFLSEGAIVFCGMEVVFSNYLMSVVNLDSRIIDQSRVYFGLKLSQFLTG